MPAIPHWGFGEALPVLDPREDRRDPETLAYGYVTLAALIDRGLVGTYELVSEREGYVDAVPVLEQADFGFVVEPFMETHAQRIIALLREKGHTVIHCNDLLVPGGSYAEAESDLIDRVGVVVQVASPEEVREDAGRYWQVPVHDLRERVLKQNKLHLFIFDRNLNRSEYVYGSGSGLVHLNSGSRPVDLLRSLKRALSRAREQERVQPLEL